MLHRELEEVGLCNRAVNPASIKRARNDRVKTDKLDSKKLAKRLYLDILKPNYIPSPEEVEARQLHRCRAQMVEGCLRVGNRIKSLAGHKKGCVSL